jgi:hypothetical protein
MSSVGIGAKREVWTRGPHRLLGYKRQSLVMGIKSEVYPREGDIHVFQSTIYCSKTRGREKSKGQITIGRPWKFFKSGMCE